MRRSLERSDTIINLRNQEIATLNSRLAANDETIAEAAEQFDRLDQEVTQLRSQLQTEKTRGEELWEELSDTEEALTKVRAELVDREKELAAALAEVLDLKQKLAAAPTENPEPEQKLAAAGKDLLKAADVLNQLKGRRKKSRADLGDMEVVLGLLGHSGG